MRRFVFSLFTAWAFGLPAVQAQSGTELLVCGDSLLRIFPGKPPTIGTTPVFTWHVGEARHLPTKAYQQFRSIDDCKPHPRRNEVLLTSSSGGVGVLDRATKQLRFYAPGPNAHSAEWLPGERIAVALSTAPGGNRIQVYALAQPDRPVWSDSLYSAHGLVWDANRRVLYALGYDQLREYEPAATGFTLRKTHPLPDADGHELQAIPGTDSLLVSTHGGVWSFDRRTQTFRPFAPLAGVPLVKSVAFYPTDRRRVAYVRAEESWWGKSLYFLGERPVRFDGVKLYKIRWWVER